MTIEEIIINLKLHIKGAELSITSLDNMISENKKRFGNGSYIVGFQLGERNTTLFYKECLEDLLQLIEDEEFQEE